MADADDGQPAPSNDQEEPGPTPTPRDFGDGSLELTDLDRLIQALLNEKNAPEILPFQTEVVAGIEGALESQDALIEDLSSKQDMELSRIIFTQEVRRVRYALRAYYRARLRKIERFAAAILDNGEVRARLTRKEELFCQDVFVTLGRHQKECVLNHLGDQFASLVKESELSVSRDMIATPRLDSHVFCNLLQDVGPVEVDDEGSVVDMRQGDLYIVKYQPVSKLVYDGRAVLI